MTWNEWIKSVFSTPTPSGALVIAGKTLVIYIFLVLGLRLTGKRQLGQMTLYDVILIIVLANAVQNSMVGDDSTLVGGIVAAVTLLIVSRIFSFLLARNSKIESVMVGQPSLIISSGELVKEHMDREGITEEQVYAALREHGITEISEVEMGVLEVDGTISIVPSNSTVHRTRRHYKGLRLP